MPLRSPIQTTMTRVFQSKANVCAAVPAIAPVAGGRCYVRTGKGVRCFELRKGARPPRTEPQSEE